MRASSVHRRAELRAGVAGDHLGSGPRREDSRAGRGSRALRALSRPDAAPTRHARAASARSRGSRRGRPRPLRRPDSGTPITGRSVCAATRAGERRRDAGPGDDHAQAPHARVLGVLGHQVRFAVGGHHAHLVQDAALVELAGRLLHRLHVALGAHHDAHVGGVHVDVIELRLHLGLVASARGRARSLRPRGPGRPSWAEGSCSRSLPWVICAPPAVCVLDTRRFP